MEKEEQKHSSCYERLNEENKEIVDTIIGFLSNKNTALADKILFAAQDELKYVSVIKG